MVKSRLIVRIVESGCYDFTIDILTLARLVSLGRRKCPTNRNYRLEALTEERKPVLAVGRQGA
jgi:hypothetical protein